jgi:hypothetical protein
MAGVSSQGTYFSFAGAAYTATRVTVTQGDGGTGSGAAQRQRVSIATLASDPEWYEPFIPIWLPDPNGEGDDSGDEGKTRTVELDFIGQTMPTAGVVGTVAVSGKISFSGQATCTGASLTASVGDIVRGTASFKVKV